MIQMKEESEVDRGTRKSNRQRVPNPFYAEGISELKKAPRPPREPLQKQSSRKRSLVYQEDNENSEEEGEEERSELARESNDWYPCRLPKSGQLMKVQFVLQPQDPPERKREEPPRPKKSEPDLLSLFQMAIENVNEQLVAGSQKDPGNEAALPKQPPRRKEGAVRQRRGEDSQGRITGVVVLQGKLVLRHSKLGEVEFVSCEGGRMREEEGWGVGKLRERLSSCESLRQCSVFRT